MHFRRRRDTTPGERIARIRIFAARSARLSGNAGVITSYSIHYTKLYDLAHKGLDGIIDISPFTCMNGIVSEAIYPRLSRDLDGLPLRSFYFDGAELDLDRDIGVYLELARTYQKRKKYQRG